MSGGTSAPASISGTVTDADGAGIAGAVVSLTLEGPASSAKTFTDTGGHFSFPIVVGHSYRLSVKADGFGTGTASGALDSGADIDVPVTLAAAANIDVEVGALTQVELAEQQIHIEETQRLIGIVPNFYVSYDWKAAPLNPRQKFQMAIKTTFDPVTLFFVSAFTGYDQVENHFEEYGGGPAGFGKRFGANLADAALGTMVGDYLMPVIFHQDPRYFYKGSGSVVSRTLYALSTAFICRGDNGKWQPNYSGLAGNLTAGLVSNLYYPANDRSGVSLTFENALVGIVSSGAGNIFQEFFSHTFTRHAPPTSPAATTPAKP